MGTLIVSEYVSLNGVIEAPGGEPGHPHTGWAVEYHDDELLRFKVEVVIAAESLLIGRVTYESFAAAWPARDGEFADKMTAMPKHVISSTLGDPPGWENSRVLRGDVRAEVARLKGSAGGPILVVGSGTLVHALVEHDLVDEYRVMVFPVVVAEGARLFPDLRERRPLALTGSTAFGSGVVVHAYRPA